MRVFGCLCYANNRPTVKDKFGPRSRKFIFVGYPFGKKGWRLYDLEKNEYFVSRDVLFIENKFPYATSTEVVDDVSMHEFANQNNSFVDDVITTEKRKSDIEVEDELDPEHVPTVNPTIVPHLDTMTSSTENLGKGHRVRKPSTRLKGYIPTLSMLKTLSLVLIHSLQHGPHVHQFNIAYYVNNDAFSVRHRKFLAAITASEEPISFAQANQSPEWCMAMKEEIDALERNGTWTLEDLPLGKTTLRCKWVYKIKYKEDALIERLKARLVFGNRQVAGIDFNETFAPVAKMMTLQMFLAVAVGCPQCFSSR